MTFLVAALALCVDRLLGEPSRWHPLVGFGSAANTVEAYLLGQRWQQESPRWLRLRGLLGLVTLVVVPVSLVVLCLGLLTGWLSFLFSLVVLYLCVGGRSLSEHAVAIEKPLSAGHLPEARLALGNIVSRDTQALSEERIASGAIESVLENGSDAVLAPLFWYAVAGAPGALAYRLINTLDAMWGYRTQRYQAFGWSAAKLDDLVNWGPARGCALAYSLAGDFTRALRCWRSQAGPIDSPNAGPVMAAGAGALGVRVGGAARYQGELQERTPLGEGRDPVAGDISAALSLLNRATALWLLVIGVSVMVL